MAAMDIDMPLGGDAIPGAAFATLMAGQDAAQLTHADGAVEGADAPDIAMDMDGVAETSDAAPATPKKLPATLDITRADAEPFGAWRGAAACACAHLRPIADSLRWILAVDEVLPALPEKTPDTDTAGDASGAVALTPEERQKLSPAEQAAYVRSRMKPEELMAAIAETLGTAYPAAQLRVRVRGDADAPFSPFATSLVPLQAHLFTRLRGVNAKRVESIIKWLPLVNVPVFVSAQRLIISGQMNLPVDTSMHAVRVVLHHKLIYTNLLGAEQAERVQVILQECASHMSQIGQQLVAFLGRLFPRRDAPAVAAMHEAGMSAEDVARVLSSRPHEDPAVLAQMFAALASFTLEYIRAQERAVLRMVSGSDDAGLDVLLTPREAPPPEMLVEDMVPDMRNTNDVGAIERMGATITAKLMQQEQPDAPCGECALTGQRVCTHGLGGVPGHVQKGRAVDKARARFDEINEREGKSAGRHKAKKDLRSAIVKAQKAYSKVDLRIEKQAKDVLDAESLTVRGTARRMLAAGADGLGGSFADVCSLQCAIGWYYALQRMVQLELMYTEADGP